MAHTKKYILEHYECDGQLSIDDLPFEGESVDNFVTDVDKIDWHDVCINCTLLSCDFCTRWYDFAEL